MTLTPISLLARLRLACLALSTLASCGGPNVQAHYQRYRPLLLSGDFDAALEYVDSEKEGLYGFKNRLLYYYDRGMLLSLAGQHEASNRVMEQAKATVEELWTESISEHALSWITTDNSLSFVGEDFENVMIHFVTMQNCLQIDDYDAARVEARQVTNKLELFNTNYEELQTSRNHYSDDGFARWLVGMLAETDEDAPTFTALNDAWIDYRQALKVYRRDYGRYGTTEPRQLVADALRVLDGLGPDFAQEKLAMQTLYPDVEYLGQEKAAELGRIVLIHSAGEAPHKTDAFWNVEDGGQRVRIAYPKFVAKPHQIDRARLVVDGTPASVDLAEDVTAIAIENLADHMERIRLKATARALGKHVIGRAAKEIAESAAGPGRALAAAAGDALTEEYQAAEEADKRSWLTLPSRISVSRAFVTPGRVEVEIEYLDRLGRALPDLTERKTVQVRAGQTEFLIVRTFE